MRNDSDNQRVEASMEMGSLGSGVWGQEFGVRSLAVGRLGSHLQMSLISLNGRRMKFNLE
jgi:hypothetical protein